MTLDTVTLTGSGPDVLAEAAQLTGLDGAKLLRQIVGGLLVQKGVDWTAPILAEYLGLHDKSLATFVLIWDKGARRFIAHGAMFQSVEYPAVGLVAHIRTDDRCKGQGLGTRVTDGVLRAGFERGAKFIVLATDDKLHRVQAGEKAANRMYEKLGFAVLAEKRLADTVDWLMVINRELLKETDLYRASHDGRLPKVPTETVVKLRAGMVASLRDALAAGRGCSVGPVTNGDLAALFLLFNLCPPDDFQVKLSAWNVQVGPELEREFVVSLRPAMEDRDRVEDASRVLRDESGLIVAVCAAKQEVPFTRQTYRVDFYCLPALLRSQPDAIEHLVRQTLAVLAGPTRVAFWGVDSEKIALFERLGFVASPGRLRLLAPQTGTTFEAREFVTDL